MGLIRRSITGCSFFRGLEASAPDLRLSVSRSTIHRTDLILRKTGELTIGERSLSLVHALRPRSLSDLITVGGSERSVTLRGLVC